MAYVEHGKASGKVVITQRHQGERRVDPEFSSR